MPDYYPPRLNLTLVRFCQTIAPSLVHWLYHVDLEIDPECLRKLLALKAERLLLLPNHPTFQDPIVIFLLSAKLHQTFYYLAAYEGFKGTLGPFLQRLGVYSIRRGVADRPSIVQTLDVLTQSNSLVIFPEGGCSFQNDTVMPFRVGGVQIAFQALNRFAKQGEEVPNLFAVPVSIKYRYTKNMAPIIRQSLNRLENALGLSADGTEYDRLRTIAERVLTTIEQEYGLSAPDVTQKPWNDRIAALKSHVLQECEQLLGLRSTPNELARERVYRIQHSIRDSNDELSERSLSDPSRPNPWTLKTVEQAMFRLLNFDAIYDGYVAANPTQERFLDTLVRLEREVFRIDQPPPKGHRHANVRIGNPINLKDHFDDYQKNRSNTVNSLVLTMQQVVQQNLDSL